SMWGSGKGDSWDGLACRERTSVAAPRPSRRHLHRPSATTPRRPATFRPMPLSKLVVLGLDAADLDVMRPLIDRGEMPHVARLMAQGSSGVLHSTVPPVSAPAWASFLTGRNPGKHGLYSFVVEHGGGRMQLAN